MIPFMNLKVQYATIRDEVSRAVERVLESGQYALGPEVDAFEREFAEYCGVAHAVAVNSGTSALHMALLAAGVGPGDEVITTPFTFVATVAAIVQSGAQPEFADIEAGSFLIEPAAIERAVTPRTKAIVPVHLYGQAADMDPILEVAAARGLAVIEDAAQSHGAAYRGRRTGSLGDFGCFSFYPSKNLGACGEGGMVVTNDPSRARKLRLIRDWGQEGKYRYVVRGSNFRMDNLQACILRIKLRWLEAWNDQRRRLARIYDERLADAPAECPRELSGNHHVYHLYAIRSNARDQLRDALAAAEIQSAIHYPLPVHLMPVWCSDRYRPGDFPNAEVAAREVLSLPLYPELGEEALNRVAACVANFKPQHAGAAP